MKSKLDQDKERDYTQPLVDSCIHGVHGVRMVEGYLRSPNCDLCATEHRLEIAKH